MKFVRKGKKIKKTPKIANEARMNYSFGKRSFKRKYARPIAMNG